MLQYTTILLSQPLRVRCTKEIRGKKIQIPGFVYYECFKKLRMKLSDHEAMAVISGLQSYEHLVLTPEVALLAADLSIQYKLAMADSIVLAHATSISEILLTLDHDFLSIPGVNVLQ
ncbi:MAG: PIN domain-containing protein [Deltaproteobacteria bacterium]|nr:PIN domain-containing protein [Deltaproteobacteria bacterium]